MINKIAQLDELIQRACELKRRHFRPGFDNMSAASAIIWLKVNGQKLCEDILKGTYTPMPAIGFRIAKKSGKYRQLSRLTAIDSIIQAQLLFILNPICESVFSQSSFAYRPGKGASAALEMYCRNGMKYRYAERIDPVACFDNIQHAILEEALKSFIPDEAICRLILLFAGMPVFSDGEILQREMGLLQGSSLSPLLCNMYLHSLDMLLEEKNIAFVRYADDIVIFADTLEDLSQSSSLVKEHLNQLGLAVNEKKNRLDASVNLEFLNARFGYDSKGILVVREKDSVADAYCTWNKSVPRNTRRTIDILSDGILRQKDFTLAFESDEKETSIPVQTIECINVYSDVIFDSGFLKRAAHNGIYVNVFDEHDSLVGHFIPNTPLKAPRLTFEQLSAYYDPVHRLELARSIVLARLYNLRLNVRYHCKQYSEENSIYKIALEKLNDLQKQIKLCNEHEDLMLLEANARSIYYDCFDGFLRAEGFRFEKRSRRPPENEINAVLSFGNTVLYNWFACRINRSALDVRVGFLHATNQRKESLNLDLADIFKPFLVDRVALALINRRALQKKHFVWTENGGVYLSREGKHIFMEAFYSKMEESLMIKNKSMQYHEIMTEEVYKLVRHFKGREKYRAYKQVR